MPLTQRNPDAATCSILIVESSDDTRAGLRQEIERLGQEVTVVNERAEAVAYEQRNDFDLLVSDLVNAASDGGIVRSFKLAVAGQPGRRAIPALHDIIERTLAFKLRCIEAVEDFSRVREKIELELPSDLTLMNAVLEYLLGR